ncbi:MAG: cation diffusion facilitator family transporter [Bdellovibrionaceae bacterium]|jgi:solute carrier family 30 (zinc transporter), member 9|nr:cation diffusion facilitator family transporter [Pseudobdellovibrionaceae bacterium]
MSQEIKDSSFKAVVAAILGNGVITVLKFIGWVFTASPSMLAESIHSLADTSNQLLLYVGIKHSRWGPTKEFPWGRSNARYVWNLASAIGVFFLGFGVTTYHGVSSLIHHQQIQQSWNIWIIAILVFSFFLEGYVFLIAYKGIIEEKGKMSLSEYIRKGDNPTTVAVLLEDGVAVLGITMAFIGIGLSHYFQSSIPDAIASIFIGVLMGCLAIVLAYSNGRLLIGVSAHPESVDKMQEFMEALHYVEKVTSIKTEVMGPNQIHLVAEVEFHGGFFIDRDQLVKEAKQIRSGDDPLPILVNTAERTVRIVGQVINQLEKELYIEFPELKLIELEVN